MLQSNANANAPAAPADPAVEQKQAASVTIVTGGNTGIGKATALELAKQGHHIFLACRNEKAALPAIEEIKKESGNNNIEFLPLDLNSLQSVRESANKFLERKLPLNLLINNAGIINGSALTADGFQSCFGVNHLGPFLFTILLVPRLRESQPSRIVHVASAAHFGASVPKSWDNELVKPPIVGNAAQWSHYQFSKLCNVVFSNDLAARLAGSGVTSNSLHPGVVASDVMRNLPTFLQWISRPFMKSTADGAKTSVYVATSPDVAALTGKYFDNCKLKAEKPLANDPKLREELWRRSVQWSGVTQEELAAAGFQ